MKMETRTTFQCDACTEEKTVHVGIMPDGWVELDFDNPHVDRSFITRHYCPDCLTKIRAAMRAKPYVPKDSTGM